MHRAVGVVDVEVDQADALPRAEGQFAVVERGTESTLVADYSRRLLNTRLSSLGVSS